MDTARVVRIDVYTVDIDGDAVSYKVDYGDGNISDWSDWYNSGDTVEFIHRYSKDSTYNIRVRAMDEYFTKSDWDTLSVHVTYNTPPEISSLKIIDGWSEGEKLIKVCVVDRDGDRVSCKVDYGDGYVSDWSEWYNSGDTVKFRHIYGEERCYVVKVKVRDEHLVESDWRTKFIYYRAAPRKPDVLEVEYGMKRRMKIRLYSVDPEGDSISYFVDYGDGEDSGWSGWYRSGDTVEFYHRYEDMGTYKVYIKVKDEHQDESDWILKYVNSFVVYFEKTFGDPGYEVAYEVQNTSDGGYIIVGYTDSFGNGGGDVYLIKLDRYGNEEWSRTFGGDGLDEGHSVSQTEDGGYIVVGTTTSFGAYGRDIYLIKVDKNGNEEWHKLLGDSDWDEGYSVRQTDDGGYIIVGTTRSSDSKGLEVYLIKTNRDGNEEWYRTFGGVKDDIGYSLEKAWDGGYMIVGSTSSYGGGKHKVYLIKVDETGEREYWKVLGKERMNKVSP